MKVRTNYLIVIVLALTYGIGLTCAFWYQTDFGTIRVRKIAISGPNQLSAYAYLPMMASADEPMPAVIATHGISGSKEMLSSIALELAKNGFVALTVDLIGHGDSEGRFGGFGHAPTDTTLGLTTAVQYLQDQAFVDSSQIGLVGHSLGAGAVRAIAASSTSVGSVVFIAGGVGDVVSEAKYGVLNTTFPKNLLMVVGEHDVLFEIPQILDTLRPLFGNPTEIVPGTTYGRFLDSTARRVILPPTTHLFEPVDPIVISEVVTWMKRALTVESDVELLPFSFRSRELAIMMSGLAFTGLVFPMSSIIVDRWAPPNGKHEELKGSLSDRQVLLLWGGIGLLLFLPMFFLGSLIPFPPSVFGNAFAWWLFSVGLVGLLIVRFLLPRYTDVQRDLVSIRWQSCNRTPMLIGIGLVALLYGIVHVSEILFLTDLRISVIPLFKALPHPKRALAVLTFIPFYWVYFWIENVYLLRLRQRPASRIVPYMDILTTVAVRTAPYVALLATNYLPMFMGNLRMFPSFLGFIMEFILGMIPFFVMSTVYSWWFEHKTHNMTMGITVNTLILAWVSAAVFPISL